MKFGRVGSRHLATWATHVLEVFGVKTGDLLKLRDGPYDFDEPLRRLDPARLAPLRGKLRRGRGTFDLARICEQAHEPSLRD